MPTRNHDIKPCLFLACPATAMARVAVATVRSPMHHAGASAGRNTASRLRVASQRGGQRRRRSPLVADGCASVDPNVDPRGGRSNNVEARACPTLLVRGGLTASDATAERIGLRVSKRVESVSRALRQPDLSVDALIAEVTSLHVDLANQLVSLAQARRVRAAAIVYEYGSAHAITVARLAGFHPFCSVGGQIDQALVLAKLQRAVAVTLAAKPAEEDPGLRFHRHVDDWAPEAPTGPSCAKNAGYPVTLPGRHARTRVRT